SRDWSSDVCSSDLARRGSPARRPSPAGTCNALPFPPFVMQQTPALLLGIEVRNRFAAWRKTTFRIYRLYRLFLLGVTPSARRPGTASAGSSLSYLAGGRIRWSSALSNNCLSPD